MNYFTYNYEEGPYGPGSFWQMFSCIRSYILVESKIEIKNWALLRKLIKSLTVKHLKKKADIFTWIEMQKILEEMFDEEKPKELVRKIMVALAYFGLLRKEEILGICIKDVRLDLSENIEVDYPYPSKRNPKGFSFTLPGWLKPTLQKYIDQLPDDMPTTNRFLRNWSNRKDGKGRVQNFGEGGITDTVKACAIWLGKDPKNFTPHSFRRSAATALANSGISVVGLTHAGRWKSTNVAQEYIADTDIARAEVANRLDGCRDMVVFQDDRKSVDCRDAIVRNSDSDGPPQKRQKVDVNERSVVYGNNYVINITGEAGGNYSFLNGGIIPNAVNGTE